MFVIYIQTIMALFIGFVVPNVTQGQLERLFHETFDAGVNVRFSKERKNQYGTLYKSATIEVISSTPCLRHFLSQVTLHGNNTFIGDGNSYKVQFAEDSAPVRKISPHVM